jgi:UPF0755 protein
MRKLFFSFVTVVAITIVGFAAVLYWLARPVVLTEDTFVEIHHGASTRAIASQLASQGVIRSPYSLLALRALHPGAKLEAGEYEFSGAVSPWQVFDKIRLGQIFYEEITVPEGSNTFDIATLLDQTGIITSEDFLKAARNTDIIRNLDAAAPSLEGYLFPSTYRITHATTADALCRTMTQEFRRQWKLLGGTDVHRVVTLASMVEKETAVPSERPMVAAVFDNRLRLKMPLQCDPTTVYAAMIDHRYNGVIRKSDLASTNAYNTYAHAGLPPGPIANPGALSLQAALQPANSEALYFVAKGDGSGSHHFSDTLAEHEQAVQNYRKTQH